MKELYKANKINGEQNLSNLEILLINCKNKKQD
jgi:hypothetical protein